LSEEQVEILTMLARNPRQRPTAAMIASLMNVAQTRAEYYLDGLKNRRLIHNQLYAGSPATYYLTEAGRAYAVEYNLV
jgi:predicted transcriptional regulator